MEAAGAALSVQVAREAQGVHEARTGLSAKVGLHKVRHEMDPQRAQLGPLPMTEYRREAGQREVY